VKITADTNVLVRAAVMDDSAQGALAANAMLEAEAVAATGGETRLLPKR